MRHVKTFAAICFILLSTVFCFYQFNIDHLLPLALGCFAVAPAWWLRPSWRRWAICIPLLSASSLVVDAFLFNHRLAVEVRSWRLIWDIDEIEGILTSPSGRTTAYIVGSHWLDSSYHVYFSTSSLFPRRAYIETAASDPSYPRGDVTATWSGALFTAGGDLISVAYDERIDKLYIYADWTYSSVSLTNPPKSREAFAKYIQTIH